MKRILALLCTFCFVKSTQRKARARLTSSSNRNKHRCSFPVSSKCLEIGGAVTFSKPSNNDSQRRLFQFPISQRIPLRLNTNWLHSSIASKNHEINMRFQNHWGQTKFARDRLQRTHFQFLSTITTKFYVTEKHYTVYNFRIRLLRFKQWVEECLRLLKQQYRSAGYLVPTTQHAKTRKLFRNSCRWKSNSQSDTRVRAQLQKVRWLDPYSSKVEP